MSRISIIGRVFVVAELIWIVYWFVMMLVFNLGDGVPLDMEASHFTGVVHVVGLPIVILTVLSMENEKDHKHLKWHLVGLLGVCFLDSRGVIHSAIHFPEAYGGGYWVNFTIIASAALALSALETIWLAIIVIQNNMAKKSVMEESLIPSETKSRMVGLKGF